MNKILKYVPSLVAQLRDQLEDDYLRHGNRWEELPREYQEHRIYARFLAYYADWLTENKEIPWLKIIGLCLIALVREGEVEKTPDLEG
jgi:hypothetical protein